MLFILFIIFSLYKSSAVHRAICYDVYSMSTTDDIVACITDPGNTTNLIVNLPNGSTGVSYVFCIEDEGGASQVNNIQLQTIGTDQIMPGMINR